MPRRFVPFSDHPNVYLTVNQDGRMVLVDSAGDVPIGSSGGGASLTGWETDADGNLVCTGGGAILPDSYASPIIVKSHFDADGPPDDDSGVFFRLVSDTWDFAGTPENKTILEANEYARLLLFKAGFNLGWRHNSGGQINWSPLDDSVNFSTLSIGGSVSGDKPGTLTWQVRDNAGATNTQLQVDQMGTLTLGASGKSLLLAGGAWTIGPDGKLTPTAAHEVPAIATTQNVVDVLVSLGILTQAS